MKHVDPETLAAWSDGGLPSGERRAVESHLADCPQCRAVAAAFGLTLEPSANVAPAVVFTPMSAARKWILPFAAAIVITAGVAWKFWPRAEQPVQMAATPAPAPPAAPTVAPPVTPPISQGAAVSESRAVAPPARTRKPSEPKAKARDVIEGIPTIDAPRPAAAAPPPPPPAAMPAPPPPPPQAPAIAPPTGSVAQAAASGRSMDLMRTEAVTVSATPWRVIDVFAQSNERLANTAAGGGGGAGRGGGTRVTLASAPMRWRANAPDSIERSTDNGATWTPMVIVGPTGTLTAGHSPGVGVCWFVGKAGVVLRSQAGGPFVRVTPPESVDLVSVVAVDHLQATVFTADGRSFVTTDGGQTWRARF